MKPVLEAGAGIMNHAGKAGAGIHAKTTNGMMPLMIGSYASYIEVMESSQRSRSLVMRCVDIGPCV